MKMKPKGHKAPLLTREMKTIIFIIGLITDFLLLGIFLLFFRAGYNIEYIRTIIFAALTVDSLFYVFSCKSLRKNLWHINLFSNKLLLIALLVGILALVGAIYLPPLQGILKTVPLNLWDWSIIFGLGFIELFLIEAAKWYFITKKEYD